MNAGEFFERIVGKTGAARELETMRAFDAGEVPSALLKDPWPSIVIEETIDGVPHKLELLVAPNFFAVGTNESPFFIPMWPTTAQKIADKLYAVLPTKKLADEIHKRAKNIPMAGAVPAVEPWYHAGGVPGDIGNSGAWNVANQNRKKIGAARFDQIIDGHSKNVLISPELTGSTVLLYGAVNPDGSWPLQGLSGDKHIWSYVDYSQLFRFFSRRARLDGKDTDLAFIFRDPKLSKLVSYNGAFEPVFPINKNNIGSGAPPAPSSTGGGGTGGPGSAPGKPTEWPPKKASPAPIAESSSLAMPLALAGGALAVFFLTR